MGQQDGETQVTRVAGNYYSQKTDVENFLLTVGFRRAALDNQNRAFQNPVTQGYTVLSEPRQTLHRVFFAFIPRDPFKERDALLAIKDALTKNGWRGADVVPVDPSKRWPSTIACVVNRWQDEEFIKEQRLRWARWQDRQARRYEDGQDIPIAFCGNCGGAATHMTPTPDGARVSPCGHLVHFGTRMILTNPAKGVR
jgi:hypothetical protein